MSIILFIYYYILTLYNFLYSKDEYIELYPQQVHISFYDTSKPSYTVSWHTIKNFSCEIEYGTDKLNMSSTIKSKEISYHNEFEHHILLDNIEFDTVYYYRIKNIENGTYTKTFKFRTIKQEIESTRIVFVGDVDSSIHSNATMNMISIWNKHNLFDFIIHLGDISYADNNYLFYDSYDSIWNKFMLDIEPFASQKPYMVVVGNHEAECHSPYCLFYDDIYL